MDVKDTIKLSGIPDNTEMSKAWKTKAGNAILTLLMNMHVDTYQYIKI